MTTRAHTAELFAELADRHGGLASLSLAEAAIVRTIAKLLSSDLDGKGAATVAELERLLPPRREKFDLSKLSDRQLSTLDRLVRIASGAPLPASTMRAQIAAHIRDAQTRESLAVEFCDTTTCRRCQRELSKAQVKAARTALAKAAQAAPPAIIDAQPPSSPAAQAPRPASSSPASEPSADIVPIRPRSIHEGMPKREPEPWRQDTRPGWARFDNFQY